MGEKTSVIVVPTLADGWVKCFDGIQTLKPSHNLVVLLSRTQRSRGCVLIGLKQHHFLIVLEVKVHRARKIGARAVPLVADL